MSHNDNLYKAITKAMSMLQYCTFYTFTAWKCQSNQNEIFWSVFLWFISSKLINVQQTHVKYINPAWINVEVKVIDIFLLLFTDISWCVIWDNQSLTCKNIYKEKGSKKNLLSRYMVKMNYIG